MWKSGDNTMGLNWSGLGSALKAFSDKTKKMNTKIYSPEELEGYNKAIARGGVNMGALPDNLLRQLENTYTPYQKALRQWSNEKQAADKGGIFGSFNWDNLGDALGSIFSGGISDVIQGKAPGSGVSSLHPLMAIFDPISKLYSAGTGMMYDIAAGIDKAGKTDGSFWNKLAAAVDRSLDPSGAVDTATRYTGEAIKTALPAATPYLQTAGTAIGTLIGALTPITPFGGALVGNALGGKLQQGTRNKDYLDSWRDAGIVAGTYGVGKVVAPYLSSLVGGGTLGKVVGNLGSALAKKGVKTLASLMPNASWDTSVGGSEGVSNLLTALLGGATTNTSTGVSKALKALTGSTSSSLLTGKEVARRGLQSIGGESNTPKYAKNAISILTSNPSELSDAVANTEIRNAGMIKQPEWLVNTADMEREDKIDYMQAIKQLLST